jgi:hypothetical protein
MASPLASLRNGHLWLPGYLRSRLRARIQPRTAWVAICDHFEPLWHGAGRATALERVRRWREAWPALAARHRDSEGRSPQYTFFYPEEEYRPELLAPLAEMVRSGVADVEVHLHHDADTRDGFEEKISRFARVLCTEHGLLREHEGRLAFGFIHGNWALDNARPDGRWCGLNDEISLLRDLGCYADFTLPAAPDPSQAGPVNAIFGVTDDPDRPRSHARGTLVKRGTPKQDLTLITGPLGVTSGGPGQPRLQLENGDLAHYRRPSARRVSAWLALAPRIEDRAFVKLFAHGAQEKNAACLLEGDLDLLFRELAAQCSRRGIRLRYVTAWEMWNAVERLRRGGPAGAGG